MNSFELVGDPSRVSLTFITIPDVFTGARLFSAKYIMEFFGNVGLNQAQHFLLFSEIKPLSRIQGLHYQTAVFCKCDTVNRFYWLASWESAFFSIIESQTVTASLSVVVFTKLLMRLLENLSTQRP